MVSGRRGAKPHSRRGGNVWFKVMFCIAACNILVITRYVFQKVLVLVVYWLVLHGFYVDGFFFCGLYFVLREGAVNLL